MKLIILTLAIVALALAGVYVMLRTKGKVKPITDYTRTYQDGPVTLTAPESWKSPTYHFSHWEGDCVPDGLSCTLKGGIDVKVTAVYR